MKTQCRTLRFNFIERRFHHVALAAALFGTAIVVHGVLVVSPSNGAATLARTSDESAISLPSEMQITFGEVDRQFRERPEIREIILTSTTNVSGTSARSPIDDAGPVSTLLTPQEGALPLPQLKPIPSTPMGVADTKAEQPGSSNKPAISALGSIEDGSALPLTISAIADEDPAATTKTESASQSAISATAQ